MSVQLWGLRKRGDFCDVVIRVQGTTVKCHKLVLVACSDYFASMFNTSHQFRENREGLSEVSLEADIYQVTIYATNIFPYSSYTTYTRGSPWRWSRVFSTTSTTGDSSPKCSPHKYNQSLTSTDSPTFGKWRS